MERVRSCLPGLRRRRDERPCIGLARTLDNLVRRPLFNDAPVLYHRNLVGHRADHGEVVTDMHIGQAVRLLQLFEQGENAYLDRAVEGRGRLVEHHETRY
jgi:hypothetical protein